MITALRCGYVQKKEVLEASKELISDEEHVVGLRSVRFALVPASVVAARLAPQPSPGDARLTASGMAVQYANVKAGRAAHCRFGLKYSCRLRSSSTFRSVGRKTVSITLNRVTFQGKHWRMKSRAMPGDKVACCVFAPMGDECKRPVFAWLEAFSEASA